MVNGLVRLVQELQITEKSSPLESSPHEVSRSKLCQSMALDLFKYIVTSL